MLQGAIPTPREYLSFTPGDDYKLADYAQISGYFQKLAAASDRVKVIEFGKSALGKPMYAAFISAPENLAKLDQYRELNRQLALGLVDQAAARTLAERGKAIVWIDSGLHASEVAPSQHAPELAYKMITDESEETRRIRDKVILIQIPAINPDGLDWIVKWYRGNVGTPYELAPLPWIYQKYAGHDNNRDWFMLNLAETRAVTTLLFQDWFPEIVYNQHQAPAFPARIFVPPYSEPLNPNIPAPVMEGINLIGSAIKERLARNNQPGALSYLGYDAWWNGGLRSVPAFHNMHGILTETAGYLYATPKTYPATDFPDRFANGMPTREATVFYERPWLGGKWGVRDAIEYMLTADAAILDLAATRSSHYLLKSYDMARAAIASGAKGKPYAYVIAPRQWDASSASEMLERLSLAGVQIRRAGAPFQANGKSYPEGTSVIPVSQPFRSYVVDLMEPQKYPELKTGTTGPTKRPYDVAGWTLPFQMGVQVDRVDEPFSAQWEATVKNPPVSSTDHRENSSFLSIKDLLDRNRKVRWAADGKILIESDSGFAQARYELKNPRVAIYEPWTANIDTGWTEWVLDKYKVPHTVLHNADFAGRNLKTKFDTIILAAQSAESILHGIRPGERVPGRTGRDSDATLQRSEYAGGIELNGLAALDRFVRDGGTLIALDAATELPVQYFPLPARLLLKAESRESVREEAETASGYYCPGSLLRITVDNSNPLAFGMPKEAIAFSSGGQAFQIALLPEFNKDDREIRVVASYAKSNLLASGWISGEKQVLGKPILVESRHGKGRVVLFGFRPQFRGQSFGTFKFLLNAVYLASAENRATFLN